MKKNPLWLLTLSLLSAAVAGAAENKTRNVLLVTIDGLRWQEVFRGADGAFMNKEKNSGGVPAGELVALKAAFLGSTPEERRKKLMPFFWGTLVPGGQAFGNRDLGSAARDRKSTRLNSSHTTTSYAAFRLQKHRNSARHQTSQTVMGVPRNSDTPSLQ